MKGRRMAARRRPGRRTAECRAETGGKTEGQLTTVDSAAPEAQNAPVERQDVERIARAALKELGADRPEQAAVAPAATPDHWRIDYHSVMGPQQIQIKCGKGTTPQWVREQIFQQYLQQS